MCAVRDSDSLSQVYEFDAANRMNSVESMMHGMNKKVVYGYNAMGQRKRGKSMKEYIFIFIGSVILYFSIDASILTNMQGFRIGDGDERFIWGFTQLPEIQNLEIETQKPDEVIKYQEFGNDWYFWYYTDLQSDKTTDELNIEFVE